MANEVTRTRTRRSSGETRAHILDIAEQRFYQHGIHATGIDRVAADAGVAPTTLYRLFASKDDLVAAYVERYAIGYRGWIESVTSAPGLSPRDRILALFDGLAGITASEDFRGCPFLMTLAEYPDPGSAAHREARGVKSWVRAKIHALTGQLPHLAPEKVDTVADQLALIVEGLYGSTAALGADGPARQASSLAALIIDAARSDG